MPATGTGAGRRVGRRGPSARLHRVFGRMRRRLRTSLGRLRCRRTRAVGGLLERVAIATRIQRFHAAGRLVRPPGARRIGPRPPSLLDPPESRRTLCRSPSGREFWVFVRKRHACDERSSALSFGAPHEKALSSVTSSCPIRGDGALLTARCEHVRHGDQGSPDRVCCARCPARWFRRRPCR